MFTAANDNSKIATGHQDGSSRLATVGWLRTFEIALGRPFVIG